MKRQSFLSMILFALIVMLGCAPETRIQANESVGQYPFPSHNSPANHNTDQNLATDNAAATFPDHIKPGVVAWSSKEELPIHLKKMVEEKTGMEFILVEGGCYTMGSNTGNEDESPAHVVCVDAFWMARTEVTQEQWLKIEPNNPSVFKESSRPVESVSWRDANQFIDNLNLLTGKEYRLPTEAEWEYAARGGLYSKGYHYPGSDYCDDVANYSANSGRETTPVAQKKMNELALYDLAGNVAEWCNDWYRKNYYRKSPKENPTGAHPAVFRVYRGGHWLSGPDGMRVSGRGAGGTTGSGAYLGFRLVQPNVQGPVLETARDGDDDGDGVPNSRDICPGTPRGVIVDEDGCPVKFTLRIQFAFDRTEIRPEYHKELVKANAFIRQYPGATFTLVGHTDNYGSDAYNVDLSMRRSISVKNYLVTNFSVDPAQLHPKGFGEKQPVDTNLSDEGRHHNRRVEVTYSGNMGEKQVSYKKAGGY
jgi:formylglycine-generating enzyme required for sulfatase activity